MVKFLRSMVPVPTYRMCLYKSKSVPSEFELKNKLFYYRYLLAGSIFAEMLDPDPNFEYGSGSMCPKKVLIWKNHWKNLWKVPFFLLLLLSTGTCELLNLKKGLTFNILASNKHWWPNINTSLVIGQVCEVPTGNVTLSLIWKVVLETLFQIRIRPDPKLNSDLDPDPKWPGKLNPDPNDVKS